MTDKYYFLNKKLITIFALILIANCFLYFLYVKNIDGELNKLTKEEESLKQQLKEVEALVLKATYMQNNVQEVDEELKYFYSQILGIKEEKLLDILREIDLLARRFDLAKSNVVYTDKQLERERLIQLDIVFPLIGSYSDIRDFIYSIEKSSYFLIIDRIELVSIERAADHVNLNVHLQAYFSGLS